MEKLKIIVQLAIDKQDKRFAGFIEAENVMGLDEQLKSNDLEGYGLAFNRDGVNQRRSSKRVWFKRFD